MEPFAMEGVCCRFLLISFGLYTLKGSNGTESLYSSLDYCWLWVALTLHI